MYVTDISGRLFAKSIEVIEMLQMFLLFIPTAQKVEYTKTSTTVIKYHCLVIRVGILLFNGA